MNKTIKVLENTYTLRSDLLKTSKFLELSDLGSSKIGKQFRQMVKCLSAANYYVYGNIKRKDDEAKIDLLGKMCHIYTYNEAIDEIERQTKEAARKYPTWHGIDFKSQFNTVLILCKILKSDIVLVTSSIDAFFQDDENERDAA